MHRRTIHDQRGTSGRDGAEAVPEAVAVEAVAVVGSILVAIVGLIGVVIARRHKNLEQATAVIRENVQNSHETNLRDDIDKIADRSERTETRLAQVERDVRSNHEMILAELRGMRRDIGRLSDRDNLLAQDDLELRKQLGGVAKQLHNYEK